MRHELERHAWVNNMTTRPLMYAARLHADLGRLDVDGFTVAYDELISKGQAMLDDEVAAHAQTAKKLKAAKKQIKALQNKLYRS